MKDKEFKDSIEEIVVNTPTFLEKGEVLAEAEVSFTKRSKKAIKKLLAECSKALNKKKGYY